MVHECFGCREGDGRFSFDGGQRLRIPERFRGPPGNVNGGMAAGMLACPVLQAASRDGVVHAAVSRITARLRAGVPVARDLRSDVKPNEGGYAVTVSHDDGVIITAQVEVARPGMSLRPRDELSSVPHERVADIEDLGRSPVPDVPPWYEETGDHPIAGCFSCGPEHPAGLYIYPRIVSDGVTCAPWSPAAEFDNGDGSLSLAVLTSAIDCSSGICMPVAMQRDLLDRDEFFLLGTMDVRYLRVAPVAMEYRVAAKALARDGRKFFGMSALVGEDGVAYAIAESTWIIANMSRTAAFGASPNVAPTQQP